MPSPTTVTVRVPAALRSCCAGAAEIELPAVDVRTLLGELERRHAALHSRICDETGAVRRHLNIFVNATNVRDGEGLDSKLVPGDVVTILAAVSGG
ncbi:MAG: MoaD family protein [Planctomycetes bacterium]|nr:MoaD family protein [Planctomycetota bacterium]